LHIYSDQTNIYLLLAKVKKMVETLRLFYIMILFVSLCLVVVDGESKLAQTCSEDFECYIKNPHVPFGHLRCFEGFCQQLEKPE